MESPSLAGVRGIVSSGMGVTLINRGLMAPDQCEWPEARQFGSTRDVKFIIRNVTAFELAKNSAGTGINIRIGMGYAPYNIAFTNQTFVHMRNN